MLTFSPHICNESDELIRTIAIFNATFDDDHFPIIHVQIVFCYSGFHAKQTKYLQFVY